VTDGITGVRGSKTRDRERTRLPYSTDDLNLILASLPTEQESPSKHFLPLLAMWTGARVEELCQLRVDDVGEEDGVPFIHICGGDGRSVKTYSATRKVPLHPELVRLGFLSYVERMKGKARLFMDLTAGPHGKYSHAYSKAWGRWTDSLGITDPRKTFHGFRHGMADALRRAGVELEIREALLGHSSGRVSAGYGSGHTLAAMFAQVQRVEFPGVEVGRLRATEGLGGLNE
jgi:integrase